MLLVVLPSVGLLSAAMMRLPIPAGIPTRLLRQRGRRVDLATLEVDVDAALVLLGRVLQPQVAAHLLDARLDLLDVADAVVPPAHDDVEVGLAAGLGVLDARLEDILGLLDELPVQVDGVFSHTPRRVVLAKDVLAGLPVVALHVRPVFLSLFGERLGLGAVAARVRLARAVETRAALSGFLPRQVAQAVVFGLGIVVGAVIEVCSWANLLAADREEEGSHVLRSPNRVIGMLADAMAADVFSGLHFAIVTVIMRPASAPDGKDRRVVQVDFR